ncbi:MAG: hypothetical protein JKX67_07295 [Colwellia sp.]|nr:hypothetical protein [Colwellia sp.]
MFSIYGKSKILAKKTVGKFMLNKNSEVSKELAEMGNATQCEKQIVIDKYVDEVFIGMKLKRCTHEFSTPHIASEAFALMEKDSKNFSDLVMMKKQNKLNADLKKVASKATGKPLMEWVPINTESKEMAA